MGNRNSKKNKNKIVSVCVEEKAPKDEEKQQKLFFSSDLPLKIIPDYYKIESSFIISFPLSEFERLKNPSIPKKCEENELSRMDHIIPDFETADETILKGLGNKLLTPREQACSQKDEADFNIKNKCEIKDEISPDSGVNNLKEEPLLLKRRIRFRKEIIEIDQKLDEVKLNRENIQNCFVTSNAHKLNNKSKFKFTSLVKRDEDLRIIEEQIEKYLDSGDADLNDKLRKFLLILKDMTQQKFDDDNINNQSSSKKEFKEKFIGLIERYYKGLYQNFWKLGLGFRPLIKLLQIFELMLVNFLEVELICLKKDLEARLFSLITKEMNESDWRFLRKLCDFRENLLVVDPYLQKDILSSFLIKIENIKRALLWKEEQLSIQCAEDIIDSLYFLHKNNQESFAQCLLAGRFDKDLMNSKVRGSLVLGDEGGLFLLINTVHPDSTEESIILESGVSMEFLCDKRKEEHKVILGEGGFGKVRFALSVFGDQKVDIGQLVCVKKTNYIGKWNAKRKSFMTLNEITDSTLEDFFAKKLNDSIYAPKSLDMAIITNKINKEEHKKGYLIMEIVPENTADKVFKDPKYQKWEYQKPYILDVLKTMRSLLLNERIFNSDLKPQNTLFDPISRKMTIIDLGRSLFIEKDQNIESFDASDGGFGLSKLYCPPEILDEDRITTLDLEKAAAYLCGVTIAAITSHIPDDVNSKSNISTWLLGEKSDLAIEFKKVFVQTVTDLIKKEPQHRITLAQAVETIERIGCDKDSRKAIYQQYIVKVKGMINKNPSALSLNIDIIEIKERGIIGQRVTKNNPRRFKMQTAKNIDQELDDFFSSSGPPENPEPVVFVLFGEAGSGKSLALQLRFIKEVNEWEYGNPIPLFFNMADEVNLKQVVRRINSNVGCNIKLEAENDKIHLFVDSYDEGPDEIIRSRTLINEFLDKLRTWKSVKIVVSCRTDFVISEIGNEDLSYFKNSAKAAHIEPKVRYIVPIGYGGDLMIKCPKCLLLMDQKKAGSKFSCNICEQKIWWKYESKGEQSIWWKPYYHCEKCGECTCIDCSKSTKYDMLFHVSDWLAKEKSSEKAEGILNKIKKLVLEERMKTGLMFNMIMKMLTSGRNFDHRPKGFEIYGCTLKLEFLENYEKVLAQRKEKKYNEQIKALESEVQALLGISTLEEQVNSSLLGEKESLSEGLEKIGEIIAAEMHRNNVNRLNFTQIEELFGKSIIAGGQEEIRTEWKVLYQILRVLGMKLEKYSSNSIYESSNIEPGPAKEQLNVGFRHETYKNYYLIRGLSQVFTASSKNNVQFPQQKDYTTLLSTVLEQRATIGNLELLRLSGEMIKNHKDLSLRDGLRNELKKEQEQNRRYLNMIKNNLIKEKTKQPCSSAKAAIVMSLLVAGEYSFSGQDLSDLDLTGSNMRGGLFYATCFDRTNLSRASLRHANLSRASFVEADLRGLDLGVWPDLIGHNNSVNSVCFSPDGNKIITGSSDKTVKLWDSSNGDCLNTLTGHI